MRKTAAELILEAYLNAIDELGQVDIIDKINIESQQELLRFKLERKLRRAHRIDIFLFIIASVCLTLTLAFGICLTLNFLK